MQHLKISERVGLIALIPLLAFVGLATATLVERYTVYKNSVTMADEIAIASVSASVIHALQAERGVSVTFLAHPDTARDRRAVDDSRAATNSAIEAFEVSQHKFALEPNSALGQAILAADAKLDSLKSARSNVDSLTISSAQLLSAYTSTIESLAKTTVGLIKALDGHHSTLLLSSYRALTAAKEAAGLERAQGSVLAAQSKFDIDLYVKLLELRSRQTDFLNEFAAFATDRDRDALERKLSTPEAMKVDDLRKKFAAGLNTQVVEGVTPAEWWAATTARIEALKSVEDVLAAEIEARNAEEVSTSRTHLILITCAIMSVLVLVFAATATLAASLIRPLKRVAEILGDVGRGKSDILPPPSLPARSEIGLVSNAMGQFLALLKAQQTAAVERQNSRVKSLVAQRELLFSMRERVESATVECLATVVQGASGMAAETEGLRTAMDHVRTTSDAAANAAEMSKSSNRHAADLSSQIAAAIGEIGGQVQRGADLAKASANRAGAAKETISALVSATNEIEKMAAIINDVAGRTNLLALNATIEAARAGEAGKGFAVVAEEVKALATQTAKASGDISARISAIQNVTHDAASSLTCIINDIGSIDEVTVAIAAAMHEQRVASAGFVETFQTVNQAVEDVAKRMSEISNTVTDVQGISQRVDDVAKRMHQDSLRARDEIPGIVRTTSEDIERRAHQRVVSTDEVILEVGGSVTSARLENMSEAGACIASTSQPPAGTEMWLTLPDAQRVHVRVIWSDVTKFGVQYLTQAAPGKTSQETAGSHGVGRSLAA